MRVGFVGLGSQGAPIAERIVASGKFDVAVWARRDEAVLPFRDGPARIATSLADLGEGLDVLGTCVFDAEGTREVLFGPSGAAHTMPSGAIVICHSTLAPDEVRDIGREAMDRFGLRLLDAPVSGGAPKASTGELVVMIGGDEATYREVLPVVETYSNAAVHLGPIGAGQHAKLLNNGLFAAHVGIANDLFVAAEDLGLDVDALGKLLLAGSGRSYGLEIRSTHGSLKPLARPPLRPAMTKDVDLLQDTLQGRPGGACLLAAASAFIEALNAAGDPNE